MPHDLLWPITIEMLPLFEEVLFLLEKNIPTPLPELKVLAA